VTKSMPEIKCGPEASTGQRERIASVMRGVVFTGHTVKDDQFDRRELLLHLGDMLEALSCLDKTDRPDAPAAQLANGLRVSPCACTEHDRGRVQRTRLERVFPMAEGR
jgi:hypothetical protein